QDAGAQVRGGNRAGDGRGRREAAALVVEEIEILVFADGAAQSRAETVVGERRDRNRLPIIGPGIGVEVLVLIEEVGGAVQGVAAPAPDQGDVGAARVIEA